MATNPDYAALLATLEKVQQHDFAILRFSESVTAAPPKGNADQPRNSDASSGFDTNTPSALQLDLNHYKELFSKLRFSYLEQVTKEKFLRAITEDPPSVVEPSENDALERTLLSAKASLQQSKADVNSVLAALETLSRKVAAGHKDVTERHVLAQTLPGEVAALETRIERESGRGEVRLPLEDTVRLVETREAELRGLETALADAGRELARKKIVLGALESEIAPLEMDKEGLERFASEAVRMRDSARAEGRADRETMGRWYKSVFEGLEALFPDKGSS